MSVREHKQLIDLIGDIYDAALDSALWTGILKRIADLMGGQATGLISRRDPTIGHFTYNWGIDPHYIRLYAEAYSKISPVLASRPRLGEIASISNFPRGHFYHEWARPQGWADLAYVVLEGSGWSRADVLVVVPNKARGMLDDELRRSMALIVPHARRALLIRKSMELKRCEAATFADTLNGLSAGMFLVDAGGRVVHANTAGQDMLYANDFLYSLGGRLAIRDPRIDQTLREVLAAATIGDAGVGTKAIALPVTAHDGERYIAHVLPLTSGERRATGLTYTAVAAVFVRKAELGSTHQAIAQAYKLTPTELRVLHAIVEIGGVPETAEALGVAETTVKTHLYHLFDKTSVSRQADLVKLVAGYSNPLVG